MPRRARRTVGIDQKVDPDALACSLAFLPSLSRESLVDQWTTAIGRPPPKGISRRLLERALAYHLQVQTLGGLQPDVLRKLKRHAASKATNGDSQASPSTRLAPGTRLIREWNGRNHAVEVTETGFQWNGCTYRSLSALAKAITGAKWSGPRFFGL